MECTEYTECCIENIHEIDAVVYGFEQYMKKKNVGSMWWNKFELFVLFQMRR